MKRDLVMKPARFLARFCALVTAFLSVAPLPALEVKPDPEPPREAILTIDYPAPGTTLFAPDSLKIQATAIDPEGDIRRVEFFAGEDLIGVSQHFTKDAVIPGRPRFHYLEWQNVPAGEHVLVARAIATSGAKVESKPVPISVLKSGNDVQIVRIFSARESTAEISPAAFVLPGQFVVTRKGDLSIPLRVFLNYSGTATPGKDYPALPEVVGFEPGQDRVELLVNGSLDPEGEPEELVVATIVSSPLAGPLPGYVIDSSSASAVVTIADSSTYIPTSLVSIEATRGETVEPSITSRIAPGVFTIRRTEPLDRALEVFLAYGGDATPGVDYGEMPESVKFEAGVASVEIYVGPLDDERVESDETVAAHLVEPPYQTLGLLPEYLIDPNASAAKVVIHDNDRLTSASVELLSPPDGVQYPPGSTVLIEAVSVDPNGYINRVEFLSGDQVIGVSEIIFIQAPPDGSPIHHTFEWIGPENGEVVLTARGIDANGNVVTSKPVRIEFGRVARLPLVSIYYHQPQSFAPWPNSEVIPGTFEIYRIDNDLDKPLPVWITVGGTATPGEDYAALPEVFEIPSGEKSVVFNIEAKDDDIPEKDETIVIEIAPAADTTRPIARPYLIDREHGRTEMVIYDNDGGGETRAALKFSEPSNGARFEAGADVKLRLTAWDPDGYISHVEFYNEEKMLGVSDIRFFRAPDPGTPIEHEFIWLGVPSGEHKVFAKALDSRGQPVSSSTVYFTVGGPDSRQVVLAVEATDWLGAEMGPDGSPDPIVFTIQRAAGPNDVSVTVQYRLDGSAVNGQDYAELSGVVELPAGRESVDVVVKPIMDGIEDGDESVALILEPAVCIAVIPPPPGCYLVSERSGAKARLLEVLAAPDEVTKPRFLTPDKNDAGKALMKIGAPSGQRCVLETSEDLIHWTDVGTVEVVDGEASFPEETNSVKTRAFYRLRLIGP